MRKYTSIAAAISSTLGATWWIWKWAAALGILAIVASFRLSNPTIFAVVLIVSVQVFTVSAGIAILSWLYISNLRSDATNPFLRVVQFTSTYIVRTNGEYELRQELNVQAKRTGVDRYIAKLRWTGIGTTEATVEPPDFEIVATAPDAEDFFTVYEVRFRRALKVGERRSFVLKLQMKGEAKSAQPFVAKVINDDYPNGFSQRVVLSEPPKSWSKQVYRTAHSHIPLEDDVIDHPTTTEMTQAVKHPVFGMRYMLRWTEQ